MGTPAPHSGCIFDRREPNDKSLKIYTKICAFSSNIDARGDQKMGDECPGRDGSCCYAMGYVCICHYMEVDRIGRGLFSGSNGQLVMFDLIVCSEYTLRIALLYYSTVVYIIV